MRRLAQLFLHLAFFTSADFVRSETLVEARLDLELLKGRIS